MISQKSGKKITFWLIAPDFRNRLRYPSVSLTFGMCWCFWLGRGVPKILLDVKCWYCKVRWWHLFLQTLRVLFVFVCWFPHFSFTARTVRVFVFWSRCTFRMASWYSLSDTCFISGSGLCDVTSFFENHVRQSSSLYVGRIGVYSPACWCISKTICLYKSLALKSWLDGLPRACTSKTRIARKHGSWWKVWAHKLIKFIRWCEFHCLAAPRFMFQVACGDDPFIASGIVQAIFSFAGAPKRNFGRNEKIKSDDTFWSITLALSDGFRCRFVNVELTHQGWIWFEPWCP